MTEFDPTFEDREFEEVDLIVSFAGDLEEVASRYDEAYASGERGLFKLSRTSGDRDGKVTEKVAVKAERIYSEGKQYLTNYEVSISTKYHDLSMQSFPEDIWQVICNDVVVDTSDEYDEDAEPNYIPDEDWLNELGDEETEFAVEFLYSHIVTDDGSIFTGHEMRAYVDEKVVPLPDVRLIDTSAVPESETTGENLEGLQEFLNLLMPGDIDTFRNIGKAAIEEFELTDSVVELYSQMKSAQSMTVPERIQRMRELAVQLFPDLEREDI